MEITKKYLLQLRPLDYYFFGGEQTFGNGEGQNYFAQTRKWPQQTSILGVLRHLFYPDCGPESFTLTTGKQEANFGPIAAISPLFFTKTAAGKQTDYFFSPLGPKPNGEAGQLATVGLGTQQLYHLPAFVEKEDLQQVLVAPKTGETLAFTEVFHHLDRVGVTKNILVGADRGNPRKADTKDGFYKQRMGKLATGFAFAVIVELDTIKAKHLLNGADTGQFIFPFGGEKALFELQLTATSLDFKDRLSADDFAHDYPADLQAYWLTTDTWLADATVLDDCAFVVAQPQAFRYIRTPGKVTQNFARLLQHQDYGPGNEPNDQLYKTGKYRLLQRGSLLYCTKAQQQKLAKAISLPALQQIGYNHFLPVPRSSN